MRTTWSCLVGLTLLVSCGCQDQPDPKPADIFQEPRQTEPQANVEIQPAPANFVVFSTLTFTGLPDAPHQLRATFQGSDQGRLSLSRLNDDDGDRLVEYRNHDRAFQLPQDASKVIEHGPEAAAGLFSRIAFRRAVFADNPAIEPAWQQRKFETAPGSVLREQEPSGSWRYTQLDHFGEAGESLVVTSRFENEAISWPKTLECLANGQILWTESVDSARTQSYFIESYFMPAALSPE